MPTFKDSSGLAPLQPNGDYIYCVTGFSVGISQGAKTRGSENYELELELEPSGKKVEETLIDHEKTDWKIDLFLKSAGVQITKGQAFEFREDAAKEKGVPWVNPLGLRGWCRVKQERLPKSERYPNPVTVNKLDVFYTDKEKLQRREMPDEKTPF